MKGIKNGKISNAVRHPQAENGTRSNSIIARLDDDLSRSGQAMVSGLTANAATYPAPPVLPAALTTLVSAYTTAKNAAIAAIAAAENATGSKDDALETLTDAMKSDIRYAENKVNYDDDKLKLIGWAGKKAGSCFVASLLRRSGCEGRKLLRRVA